MNICIKIKITNEIKSNNDIGQISIDVSQLINKRGRDISISHILPTIIIEHMPNIRLIGIKASNKPYITDGYITGK